MNHHARVLACFFGCLALYRSAALDSLETGFLSPPESTKPWCYWYWISDNISKEGITRDLEAMRQAGIGEAFIGNIYLEDVQIGSVKALTEEWWAMVDHALREGTRLGVNVGLFNCPGWSQSGGPWVRAEDAMRFVATREWRIAGPGPVSPKLVPYSPEFQPMAVVAFPAPPEDGSDQASAAELSSSPALETLKALTDNAPETAVAFPDLGAHRGTLTLDFRWPEPVTLRSLTLVPTKTDFSVHGKLLDVAADGTTSLVREFTLDRSNNGVNVGFMPYAPVSLSFPVLRTRCVRLEFSKVGGKAGFREIRFSAAPRVERVVEKQLGKMHPTPLPMWDAYQWPATAPLDDPALATAPGAVHDLTCRLKPDGSLDWQAPPGDWIILQTGLRITGTSNAPASPQGQGLEVDKMNRAAARRHFDAFIGKVLARVPERERRSFKRVIADSYEMGSQNWTDRFAERFRKRYGYDPLPWLPAFTGRIVGSADQTDRFLWDLRRLVADEVSYGYVGGLREACNRNGLLLWLENYGHWGFPGEFLQYGGQSDQVSGEFWATGDLGSIELRAASSAAHIYGRKVVSAEAFTSVLKFESTPWSLKKRGDWALTEGVNHWVLHVYIHQPWEDRKPGVNAWFSTEFNRYNTWFGQAREWIDYYRRCDFLLQQGHCVADVAYFIGEDAPVMTGVRKPAMPAGYNFDYINAEVIQQRLKVKDGRFVLPDGMSYRLLVLPNLETMRPEVLDKIHSLVRSGGAVFGPPPSRSPSLQDFSRADGRVRKLAAEIWGETPAPVRQVGKGRVFQGDSLEPALRELGLAPDVSGVDPRQILWTHRSTGDADIYFLSNQGEAPVSITPTFRVRGKAPETWDPVTRRISHPALHTAVPEGTRVPLNLDARGSTFVIFRRPATGPAITRVEKDGQILLSTEPARVAENKAPSANNPASTFTMAGWLKPTTDISLPSEADKGVFLDQKRNEAVAPVHGASVFGNDEHAGAGISAGRNGVVVYEHSGNYYAPLLVYAVPLTNWTHLAVVYENGRPALFIDGRPVHQGLPSRYQAHSSVTLDSSRGTGFRGEMLPFEEFNHALKAEAIAKLAAQKPEARAASPDFLVQALDRSTLEAEASLNGSYLVTTAGGVLRKVDVRALPDPLPVPGPWHVSFSDSFDAPSAIRLETLTPLSEDSRPAVKFLAGTATYSNQFELLANSMPKTGRLLLDLGRVEAIAEVSLNGVALGTFWCPPFRVDITEAARPGANSLVVRVTGTWRNRLIGAAAHPEGLPGGNGNKPWLAADIKFKPDDLLSPFGLIGPVRLLTSQKVRFSP